MNFSRPHVGAGKVKSQDKFKKILFIGCVLCAGLGIFILSSFRRTADRAMSGELVTGLNGQMTQSGFLSSVFEYFGSVTYVFPVIFVYAVWLVVLNHQPLKQINLFNLGLRLLGFNILVLGLCGLFSGLFAAGNTGAGGILGDFLNIVSFRSFSHHVAAALPVLLSLGGLMLLVCASPLSFCEKLGAAAFYALTMGRDRSEPRAVSEMQSAKDQESVKVKKTRGKLFATVYAKLASLKPKRKQPSAAPAVHADLEPSFGDLNEAEQTPAPERIEPVVEPAKESEFTREVPDFYEGHEHSYEPPLQNSFAGTGYSQGNDLQNYPGAEANLAHEDSRYQREEPFSAQRDPEPLYREVTYPESYRDQSEEGRAPSTIIRDSRLPQVEEEDQETVQNTIITKGSGLKGSFVQPAPESEDEGISTIITTHPQEEVKPAEPDDEPKVQSTIITRTEPRVPDSLPEDTAPNTAYALDREESQAHPAAEYSAAEPEYAAHSADSEYDDGADADRKTAEVAASEREALEAQFEEELDNEEFEDENIISFDSLSEERKEHTLEIKDEDLPASFVPSAQGDNFDGLRPNRTPVISEKGSDYLYANTQRGFNAEPEQPSAQQSAKSPAADDSGADSASAQSEPVRAESTAERPEAAPAQGQIPSELLSTPKPKAVTEFATKDYDHSIISAPETPYGAWRPELSLLRESETKVEVPYSEISERIARIDRFMQDFKVKAKVASYVSGPVITLFSLQLEGGISSRQIRSVSTDLTRYLMVKTIRVLDVVPGTQYVGLEVPNATRQTFTLCDVIKDDSYQHTRCLLPLCLGVNAIGKPVIADLAKAPHLLIAGTTGSGKSAGINAMLLSLLIKLSPAQLRLILIDPKRIEFSLYGDLPHLITPIIAEPEESAAALNWCVAEMERRYKLIEALGVRQLSEYNRVINEATLEGKLVYDPAWTADMGGRPDVLKPLPYLVIVVDEFADLMAMTGSQKKAEKSPEHLISRLTAKARAAGIHLILATQTPRADIVTGKIKANMPSRVAYTVQSNMESRIILDEQGAESLLGNGDMISRFMGVENYAPFRAHGPFASNDDVNAVVNAWKEHGAPEYIDGVTDVEDDSEPEGGELPAGEQKLDKLFDQVAAYAREFQAKNNREVSISAIQVQFSIGYTRSKRLMMQLQREGVI
ncbi:MAG: hypothetical protein K6F05_04150 [Succinivibrio sp.]|nr:hypothetical protein [Succinivibrio sp.]